MLALHARVKNLSQDDVGKAIADDRSLLQTWCMRGSPFFLPTADAPVFTTGVLPPTEKALSHFIAGVEQVLDKLDMTITDAVDLTAGEIDKVLSGRQLAINELGAELAGRVGRKLSKKRRELWEGKGPWGADQPLGEGVVHFCVRVLTLRKQVCFAPRDGNKAPFVLVDEPTVEDTDYSLELLRADFGDEVAHLVDGVTKLDKVKLGTAAEAETIRKMIIAMARDPRVLVIKLADRLHNMRTMRFLPPEKQARKAKETLEVLAPLAHRLGMATVKWELEDLAFAILQPKKFNEIVRLVANRAPSRENYLNTVIEELDKNLGDAKIKAQVEGRQKRYYSIHQKMIVRGRDFDDIHDLVGVRIMVEDVRDCYAAMGVVHAMWQPMPGRFKDYIAQPRFGVYQSLHTTVIGPDGKPLEVQIRTHEMHHTAEYGIAAHWRYKETRGTHDSKGVEVDEMAWMRQLLDWQREAADPGEFLESLRYDLSTQEIFVFTPKGDVITLPAGSTPVDFAYAVHTE
ncbi:RelA/SpoT family protein, partial [Kibdelosporangium lantanae]